MITYWDASALVTALQEVKVRDRLRDERSVTRPHALAEVFSTLTGGRLGFRCLPDEASKLISELAAELDFVDFDSSETLAVLNQCQRCGVRGGLIHDFLHARAALKSGASRILTLNGGDFKSFPNELLIEEP